MSAENLNKRGNPCGLCGKHHGAGPCPERTRRVAQMIQEPHYDKHVPGAGCPYCEPELREGEALAEGRVPCDYCGWLDWTARTYHRVTHKEACPHRTDGWHQGNPFPERAALAASQEKGRQLTEALEQIADPSYVGNYKPDEVVAIYRKWAANTLDSTQTNGGGERPEGWPDKCANCGADWTQISYDHALGFNCQSCGGSDAYD